VGLMRLTDLGRKEEEKEEKDERDEDEDACFYYCSILSLILTDLCPTSLL
jgi:hypothetical protein